MPITLRSPNVPTTDLQILTAIKTILPGYPTANTQLAVVSASQTGAEQIYIQNRFAMTVSTVIYPAVHLEAGAQAYQVNSQRSFHGSLQVELEYYDRWDERPDTIDTVRANIAADLERIRANLESNQSLVIGAQSYAVGLPHLALSPYMGSLVDDMVPGWLIKRTLALTYTVLPYDVAGS